MGGVKPGAKRAAEERERVIATQGAPRAMEDPKGPARDFEADGGTPEDEGGTPGPMEGQCPRATEAGRAVGRRRTDHDSDGDDGSDDDGDDFSHGNEAVMEGHKKIVSCMALEHTGAAPHRLPLRRQRYDDNAERDLRPFREIVPADGYGAVVVADGDQRLCGRHPQPKIYDRDGRELGEFDKGDMYIAT